VPATGQIARIVLLVLILAYLVNLARGTGTKWLHSKFVGNPTGKPTT
jgi:hypothetical protein